MDTRHWIWANRQKTYSPVRIHFSWLLGLQQIDVMPSLSLVIQSWMWYADYSLSSIQCMEHCPSIYVQIVRCQRFINQCTITNLANQSGDTNMVTWLHFISYTLNAQSILPRCATEAWYHLCSTYCERIGGRPTVVAQWQSTDVELPKPFHFPLFWPHNI